MTWMRRHWVFAGLLGVGVWQFNRSRPRTSDGVRADPIQRDLSGVKAFQHKGHALTPVAEFDLKAKVLAKESYRLDAASDLIPYDVAFGWQRMSEDAVYRALNITQSGRWYHYSWGEEGPPIPVDEIVAQSANMHLIPSTDRLQKAIAQLRVGDRVHLKGWLVDVERPDGWKMATSRSRFDSGAGACEVIWVTELNALMT